jgi:hypothetical protein
MQMRITSFLLVVVAAMGVLGFSEGARAQTDAQQSSQPQTRLKPAAKKTKVWTNDDVSSLRSPADIYIEKQQAKAEQEAKASEAVAREEPSAVKPTPTAHPPRLSNPKTVEDADGMIAWEQRDIDSQTEYVARLRKQLEEAPAEEKAHVQGLIDQRVKIIADTKAEQLGLMQQKKEIEKKRDAAKTAQPPQ